MSYTMKEFSQLDLSKLIDEKEKCIKCKIYPSDSQYKTSNGNYCIDCYFDELGDIVEKYPIGRIK